MEGVRLLPRGDCRFVVAVAVRRVRPQLEPGRAAFPVTVVERVHCGGEIAFRQRLLGRPHRHV
jgi:hypothetical protein